MNPSFQKEFSSCHVRTQAKAWVTESSTFWMFPGCSDPDQPQEGDETKGEHRA